MYWGLAAATVFATLLMAGIAASASAWLLEAAWSRVGRAKSFGGPAVHAECVFCWRMLPAAAAVFASCGIAFPAFLRFEPRHTSETINPFLGAIAMAGFAMSVVALFRIARGAWAGLHCMRYWRTHARLLGMCGAVPVYELDIAGSLVAAVGAFRPAIFISTAVRAALSEAELSAAILHEAAHLEVHDNLKRILLRSVPMPLRRRQADRSWSIACELAADARAVAAHASALELASALIKVGRLSHTAIPQSVLASHLVPADQPSSIAMRVERLLALSNAPSGYQPGSGWQVLLYAALPAASLACICLQPSTLAAAHQWIEKLVS
ncbi:MAG: hypothetical protein JO041_02515 [Acidobacteria bacterium]|nr:hypothetical protein [Acidobacteriota bacterium]